MFNLYTRFPDIRLYRITMEATRTAVLGMSVAAAYIELIIFPYVPTAFLLFWNMLALTTLGLRIASKLLFDRFQKNQNHEIYFLSQRIFFLAIFTAGLLWTSEIYYFELLSPTHRYMLFAVIIALTFGSTLTIGSVTGLFVLFTAPMNLYLIYKLLMTATPEGFASALFLVVSYIYSLKAARLVRKHYLHLIKNVSRIKVAKEFYEQKANHDPLSGLPNRMYFHELTQKALKQAKEEHSRMALLFIDLTKFKQINDTYGHHAGDEVIKIIGRRLLNIIREDDIAARYAGDEFVVGLCHLGNNTSVKPIVQKIYDALSQPLGLGEGLTLTVIPSIGVAIYPDHDTDLDTLLHYADTAMYYSKQKRVPFVIYTPLIENAVSGGPKRS